MTFLKRCRRTLWAVAMATVLAVSLAGSAGVAPLWTEVAGLPGPGDSPIRHVVVIYQENHSFDNVLGYQCAQWTKQRQQGQTPAHQPCDGFDPSQPIRGLTDPATGGPVYAHRATDVVENAGHSTEAQAQALANDWLGISDCAPDEGEHCLNYFTPDQIPSFAALAQQYAVSDRTFYASAVPSFGAHLEFAAATLDGFTGDNPRKGPGTANEGWGCSSTRIAPWRPTPQSPIEYLRACIPDERGALYGGGTTPVPYVPTYMTRMDAAGVSYRIYGQGHSPTTPPDQAIDYCDYFTECLATTAQRESDVNIASFLTDVSANSLPQFSVLLPFRARTDVSQHNGTSMLSGDDYINQIVSAIAGSPTLWPHTVIFVTYDDCGCQYDHRNALASLLGHGLRAPMLIISPWVKPGSTDSTTAVGIGSVLAFTEHTFGLRPLTSLDGSAYDYADSFDFTSGGRAPRPHLPRLHGIPLAEQLQLTAEAPRVDADGT